jgi:hypothetical protein
VTARIENLELAIETMHHCTARHVASEPVIELFNGEVAWGGVVEAQYVTVLQIPPVDSAETAVKIAIAAQGK